MAGRPFEEEAGLYDRESLLCGKEDLAKSEPTETRSSQNLVLFRAAGALTVALVIGVIVLSALLWK